MGSPAQQLTTSALALCVGWASPSMAYAAPPEQPDPTVAPAAAPIDPDPAAAPAPAPQPQPQPAPQPQLNPAPEWERSEPAQAPPVPAPIYEPPPLEPGPRPNPDPRNRGLGLIVAGSAAFAVGYSGAALIASFMFDPDWGGSQKNGGPMLIPVVGPFIVSARPGNDLGDTLGSAALGVTQLAGLGMLIAGSVMLSKARRSGRLSVAPGGLSLRF